MAHNQIKIDESKMYVYAFLYCGCIHESSYATMGLYKTQKSAEIAMEFHKEQSRLEHEELYSRLSEKESQELYVEFGRDERWMVVPMVVLD